MVFLRTTSPLPIRPQMKILIISNKIQKQVHVFKKSCVKSKAKLIEKYLYQICQIKI